MMKTKYDHLIGCYVAKKGRGATPKPFKSGDKINKVNSIVLMKEYVPEYKGNRTYGATFYEDDSAVACYGLHVRDHKEDV